MDPRQGHLPPSPQKEDPLASLRQRMAEKRAEIDANLSPSARARNGFDDDAAADADSLFHTAKRNKQTAGTDGTTTVRLSGGFTTTVSERGARLSKSCSGLMGMSSATS